MHAQKDCEKSCGVFEINFANNLKGIFKILLESGDYILRGENLEKVYKNSLSEVIFKFIRIVATVVVLFFTIGYFFDIKIAIIATIILVAILIIYNSKQPKTKVVIRDSELYIFVGEKEYHYNIDTAIISSERDNDTFTLKIIDENGLLEEFDMSLLGITKQRQLLDDLGVTGEKSKVIKLQAIKKN